jgi:transglutaminase-like putative cysteine protease
MDDTLGQLEKFATREAKAGHADAIAGLVAMTQIADVTRAGASRDTLTRVANNLHGSTNPTTTALEYEALSLARLIAPDVGTLGGVQDDAKLGMLPSYWIVGPFKDRDAHGLQKAEGPEATSSGTVQPDGAGDWNDGPYFVNWRKVPTEWTTMRGVPLDALIYPRNESCSYLASRLEVGRAQSLVLRVASTGSVRVMIDKTTVATSDSEHLLGLADRLAVQFDATVGSHLLMFKVCEGPTGDTGRFHAKITTESGAPATDITFSEQIAQLPAKFATLKFKEVPTPLSELLTVTADNHKTDDELLAAAMVRRLGGADDQRSPVASGLVAHAVQANPRPDILAMAGMVDPNRASASGWLAAAQERASLDAMYAPVAGFARRHQIQSRIDAGYTDWAAVTLGTSEVAKAADTDAKILRATLLSSHEQPKAAATVFEEIWQSEGAKTPTSVLRSIYSFEAADHPELAVKALTQAAKVWPRENPVDLVRVARLGQADAVKAAFIEYVRLASSVDALLAMAGELKAVGLQDDYRTTLVRIAGDYSPNRKEAWSALVSALATSPDPKQLAMTPQALMRARMLDPGSPFLRAEGEMLWGKGNTDTSDEQYLPTKESFLARRKGPPAPDAPLEQYWRELDWVRVVTIDPAGRVQQLIHSTREVVKGPKDVSDLYEPRIPAEGDSVEIVRARLHRLDGTTAIPAEIIEGERVQIRWADLKPGDVVEIATRSYLDQPIGDRSQAPFSFIDSAGSFTTHPLYYNEVVVRYPTNRPLHTAIVHDELAPITRHETSVDKNSGLNIERYVWEKPLNLPDEPMHPQSSEIIPSLIGSQFATWDDFMKWYKSGVELFSKPDDAVKKQADDVVKAAKATTREQKLHAIFNWVADEIRYVNYVSGEQWLPNRPQIVLQRRQGDCDDKAMLLITMLKAVGIEDTQEVLVQTRFTDQPSLLTANGAVIAMFDHGIAFLPGDGKNVKDRYLDATGPESRIGPLPSMDGRATAIRVVPTGTTPVVTLPAGIPADHGYDAKWAITLNEDGSARVDVNEMHSGDSAYWLRTSLKQAQSAPSWLENSHTIRRLPQIEVLATPAMDFNGELAEGRASLKFSAKSKAYARAEGTDLVVPASFDSRFVEYYAPLATRVTPVSLSYGEAPSQKILKTTITPPAGYELQEVTDGGKVDGGPFGKASLTIEKQGKTVVITQTIVFDQSQISVKEYPAWRAFLFSIDALSRREIRFTKKAK